MSAAYFCAVLHPTTPLDTRVYAHVCSKGEAMGLHQGQRAGMRRLKLRIEDPPGRKHLVFKVWASSVSLNLSTATRP